MSLTGMDIKKLIPHSGAMSLLSAAQEWDEKRLRCTASSHRDPLNPLRGDAGLSALCGIEYAAQGMALHGALLDNSNAGRQGLLISVKDVRFMVQRLDVILYDLTIDVELMMADDIMFNYQFRVSANGADLIEGKAAALFLEKETS